MFSIYDNEDRTAAGEFITPAEISTDRSDRSFIFPVMSVLLGKGITFLFVIKKMGPGKYSCITDT